MERLASVRFDRVLEGKERDELTRVLRSAGITAGPWRSPQASGRTYALLRFEGQGLPAAIAALDARFEEPPLTVLEIQPEDGERLEALALALGGAGAPDGVRDCMMLPAAVLLELDEVRTPLSTVVDIVDVELADAPRRRITPLLGLSDERLAAFAAAMLADSELDASRLIETYTEPLQTARPR